MAINQSRLLIKNAILLPVSESINFSTGDILIENEVIREIAPSIPAKNTLQIDASGLVAMPGFVQTHIHLCQTLFRNIANDLELLDWLQYKIWPLEAAHSPSSLAISARLGILELIKGGTTTILDMGSVANVEIICNEILNSGMRASVGLTFMDKPGAAPSGLIRSAADSFAYFEELSREWHGKKSDRISLNLAPRFALSCSEKELTAVAEQAARQQLLIHTHASENRKETELIKKTSGLGNVVYLHKLNLLSDRLCVAHCIWLEEEEIELIAGNKSRILHCPSSNLKLGSGIADIPKLQSKGILCSLGADGAPCNNNLNMFWEMRLASLLQKPHYGPRAMPAEDMIKMATIEGAKTLHLEQEIGSLDVGKKADLILLDLNKSHTSPGQNLPAQIVYSASPENVHSVFINGRPVMRDRKILVFDETEVLRKADEELNLLFKRVKV